MRLVKLLVNGTSAVLCLTLDTTGSPLSTLANGSLVVSMFVLFVCVIHELVQGRAELLREAKQERTRRHRAPAARTRQTQTGPTLRSVQPSGSSCKAEIRRDVHVPEWQQSRREPDCAENPRQPVTRLFEP